MKLDSKKFRFILIGIFLLGAIGFFATLYATSSALHKKSDAMVNLKLQNEQADAQLENLQAAKTQVEKYSYFKNVASTVIPNDKDQGQAVYDLSQMAAQSGILLKSITFPTSTLGIKTLSIPSSATSASASASATSASTQTIISQAKPVTGISGLYSIQFTISPQTGPNIPAPQQDQYPKMIDFLSRIENNRRTAQITKVTIEPVPNTDQLSFEFTLNIFIKP